MNSGCQKELQVDGDSKSVACKSTCDSFGDTQYCCSGLYSTPSTSKPSAYSKFKSACPRAYSYSYDEGTSTSTCASADYVINFFPSTSASISAAGDYPAAATLTDVPGDGALQASAGEWKPPSTAAYVTFAAVLAVGFRRRLD